jgi:hypothetical protein
MYKGPNSIFPGIAENGWGQAAGRDVRSLGGFWCRPLYLYGNVGELGDDELLLGWHRAEEHMHGEPCAALAILQREGI